MNKLISSMLVIFCSISLISCSTGKTKEPNKPFGSGTGMKYGIKPSHDQGKLNSDVIAFYESWKGVENGIEDPTVVKGNGDGYLAQYPNLEKPVYIIKGDITGSEPAKWAEQDPELAAVGTSEGTGYGMIIFSLMAGYDPDAQMYFDGLLNLYLRNKSNLEVDGRSGLNTMSWVIPNKYELADGSQPALTGSATDGDMDVAYALLLAHKQWGKTSSYAEVKSTYLDLAMPIIQDIYDYIISDKTYRLLMGDTFHKFNSSINDLEVRYNHTTTRPSDWILSHLRVFSGYHPGENWDKAIKEIESILPEVSKGKSGLAPDFVEDIDGKPSPALKNVPYEEWVQNESGEWVPIQKFKFLENFKDDMFGVNASRVPFRMALDYSHYGAKPAKNFLTKVSNWAATLPTRRLRNNWSNDKWYETEGDFTTAEFPRNIYSGYTLDGVPFGALEDEVNWDIAAPYTELHFIGPIGFSFFTNEDNREQVDKTWDFIASSFGGDHSSNSSYTCYFGDSIALLDLLIMSGNWWNPEK